MTSSEEEWDDADIGRNSNSVRDNNAPPADKANSAHASDHSDADGELADQAEHAGKPLVSKGNRRKRARRAAPSHSDDDFESQPTITKWFRQVPGPLQDVMKQQHADLQQSMDDDGIFISSGRSSGHAVHISTVFDDGPWVDMCDFLGISTMPGDLYGGIKMSSLKHTISHILEDDQSSPKVPRLLVLIKSMRYVDEEIVAIFHDPTGEMEGYFHRDVVERAGPALVAGTGVLLRQVSVFTPTDAAVGGASKRYLNVIPRNVTSIFVASPLASNLDSIIRTFNETQAAIVKSEEETRREESTESQSLDVERRVFAHADVRTTTTELSFISQRQVVQRHQPVRHDPQEATASHDANANGGGVVANGKNQQKKNKKKKTPDPPTGLGRWQWHQLAQKKPPATTTTEDEEPERETRRPLASSRFTELLTQHLRAKRSTTAPSSMTNVTSSSNTTAGAGATRDTAVTAIQGERTVRFSTIREEENPRQDDDEDDDDDDDGW